MGNRLAEGLERLFEVGENTPGVALGLVQDGEIVARRCAGLANLEHRAPICSTTRFHLVSVTKTFTAAAILLLQAEGKLTLDDDIRDHLPDLALAQGPAIVIRDLLSMTSGLYDSLEIERLRGIWRPSPERERDCIDLVLAQHQRSFLPRAMFAYCNANFVLLAEIIRRATGLDADAYRRQAIYQPLGLVATQARAHDGIVLPDLADGYVPDGRGHWWRATEIVGISGDVVTSCLDDLLTWVKALRRGRIGTVEITASMSTPARLADGRAIPYGLGLALRRYRGLDVLCHSGIQPGYKTHICLVPERDIGVVVIGNRDDLPPSATAAAMMDILLEGPPTTKQFVAPGPLPSPAAAAPGIYVDPANGEYLSLRLEDTTLVAETLGDTVTLYPDKGGGFACGDDYRSTFPLSLHPSDEGLKADLAGLPCHFEKASAPRLDTAALRAYAGVYENEETGITHRVTVSSERGLLVTYGPPYERAKTFAMEALAADFFLVRPKAPGVSHRHAVRFERSVDGSVVAAILTLERLKGLRLIRRIG
jgi:D-aminopeptidase